MGSVSNAFAQFAPARIVFGAIVVSLGGIGLLLLFIVVRRWMRGRYFARRDAIAAYIRQHWETLLTLRVLPERFRTHGLEREVLESILLDRIASVGRTELAPLLDCLRRSGLLDMRIREARTDQGWTQRSALVMLGRTRAPEAVPALSEGLESPNAETRVAAVRGLGKIAEPSAALPMLVRFTAGKLEVPWGVLKNALLGCCADQPALLIRHLRMAEGTQRELLARVLSEIADNAHADELIILAGDMSAEVRAAAARGLARVSAELSLPPLSQLAIDAEWFVRLRAVVSLASFVCKGALPLLVRLLSDSHRLVRQRAAWALIRSPQLLQEVLKKVIDAGDDYGLQAVVAELDRCGLYRSTVEQVRRSSDGERTGALLERARARLSPGGPSARERLSEPAPAEVCIA